MPRTDPTPNSISKQPSRKLKGIWIPIAIWDYQRKTYVIKDGVRTPVSGMSLLEKVMLAEIWHLEDDDKGCWASNEYFAKLFDVSEQSISNAVSWLNKQGHISVIFPEPNNKKKREIRILEFLFTAGGLNKNSYTGLNKNSYLRKNASAPLESTAELAFSPPENIVNTEYKNQNIKHSAEKARADFKKSTNQSPAKARAESRRKTPDPAIQRIINHFSASYAHETGGRRYPVSRSRDYPAAKSALAALGEDDAKACADFFLTSAAMKWARDNRGIVLSIAFEQRTITKFHAERPKRRQPGDGFGGAKVHVANV